MRASWTIPIVCLMAMGGCGNRPPGAPTASLHPAVVDAQTRFTFGGKPIPPYFLADFCGGTDASDFWQRGMGARITAVAVEGLFYDAGDGSYGGCTFTQGDWVRFELPNTGDPGPRGASWLSYRFVGTSPSGVTVVETAGNTGGSATFPGVLLLRFEMETIGHTESAKQERLIMRFIGAEAWGDRVYREVQIVGNELRLGPERSDLLGNADSLEPARTILLE